MKRRKNRSGKSFVSRKKKNYEKMNIKNDIGNNDIKIIENIIYRKK